MRAPRAALALLATLALAAPAAAQQTRRPAGTAQPAPKQEPVPPAPEPEIDLPYEPELLKLSEAMGALAFLRGLCTGAEEPLWRERMAALIESEGRSAARKARLAAAWNRGFRAYALVYRSCTLSAQEALVRLAREGEALSKALAGRFGG